jgi:DNA invertase Pin-like site-specific DNA recombinase
MKKVIELIRVSTESQAASDRASIPAQRAVNRRTAAAYDLTIIRSIEMADVSGAAVLMAPEIQELISLMNDREIHGVVAREFSRLMRPENFSDYALLQAFADSNTILYLPEGPIDFSSKTGRLLGTIRAAIAGMERTEILERIWSAKEEKRRAGGFAQSRICLPFGVTFNGKWAYTPDAERVREAFRLLLSGETSYVTIGKHVEIDPYSLRIILRNPIYTGWRVIDKRRDMSPSGKYPTKNGRQGDRRRVKRAPEDVIRVKVINEPLITEPEFNRAQEIMDLKKQLHWRLNKNPRRFTYGGFLFCKCGALLYSKNYRGDYYICKARCGAKYQQRVILDPLLDKIFAEKLTSSGFLQSHIMPAFKAKPKSDGKYERIQAQLRTLDAKRQRILDAYFDSVIDSTERDKRIAELDRERIALNAIASREKPRASLSLEMLVDTFAPFVEFDLLNREDKRALLNTITPSITVSDYHVQGMYIGLEVNHTDTDSSQRLTRMKREKLTTSKHD